MHNLPSTTSHRRGIAMVMVLVVVAIASIMAYAVLASASIGTKVADATSTRLQRKYLAESGLHLAIYYLHNPESSPVSPVFGEWGNVHYPGESNIHLGAIPGTLTIRVTNTANGVFDIVSTGVLDQDSHTATATIKLDKYRKFDRGGNFLSNIALNNKISITGGLTTVGSILLNTASVLGLISATNGQSVGGTAVEPTALTRFPVSMTAYLPHYYVKGKRYTAKRLTSSNVLLGLLDLDLINNPHNVWYTTSNVNFLLTTSMNGSFVAMNGANITIQGNATITASAGLPAMLCDGNLVISGGARTVTLNGPVYVKKQITSPSSSASTSRININGPFISGTTESLINGYTGFINIVFDPEHATIQGVMDEIEPVHQMTIQSWETNRSTQ